MASMQSSMFMPPGVSSSAERRAPTAMGRSPTVSRIAVRTSLREAQPRGEVVTGPRVAAPVALAREELGG